MSIYKNKYRVEKELFACFQKEIMHSRDQVTVLRVADAKEVVDPVVETEPLPVL